MRKGVRGMERRCEIRGGSWASDRMYARAVDRVYDLPANRLDDIGFRLLRHGWKGVGRIRGGSWFFEAVQSRVRKECACRVNLRDGDQGMRLVRREVK